MGNNLFYKSRKIKIKTSSMKARHLRSEIMAPAKGKSLDF